VTTRRGFHGQGAMEYLMSYGWAILVVLVIGVTLWQLGIFSAAPSTITSNGFPVIKPLLTACGMKKDVRFPGFMNGFECQFTNPTQDIWIRDIDVRINGKTCFRMYTDVVPAFTNFKSYMVARGCADDNGNCPGYLCWDFRSGVQVDCSLTGAEMTKDSTFLVQAFSHNAFHTAFPDEPCYVIDQESQHNVFIDITYDTVIGGIKTERHNSGTVHIGGG